MKIIQITDLHLATEDTDTRGVNVIQNFLDIITAIQREKPDLLVITGDVTYSEGNFEMYDWVKTNLEELQIPYRAIAGNHDNNLLLAKMFSNQNQGRTYWSEKMGNRKVFFIDSSDGIVPETQLQWLSQELGLVQEDAVIFMHHPPVRAGVKYMDEKWPLQNKETLQKILYDFPHLITVFCGHFHVEKTIQQKNITVHITPSTFCQMKWTSEQFELDHYRIAYREINFRNDGAIDSTVVYLEGNIL